MKGSGNSVRDTVVPKSDCFSSSADTIRHSSIGMELAPIKKLFAAVTNKARRSKMVPSIGYYRVAAIDGTGLFSTRSRCCPACQEVHHQDGTVTYEHKVVTCQVVGGKPPLILGHEGLKVAPKFLR